MTRFHADRPQHQNKRIDRPLAKKVSRALEEAGIRPPAEFGLGDCGRVQIGAADEFRSQGVAELPEVHIDPTHGGFGVLAQEPMRSLDLA